MSATFRLALAGAVAALACGPGADTGPAELAWDRDACERCRMAISDRHFAAQVRLEGVRAAHVFDDLGCALLWIDASDAAAREIWVRSPDGTAWLDAREARYVGERHTPMSYGFGTVAEGGEGLASVWDAVRKREDERRSDRAEDHGHH